MPAFAKAIASQLGSNSSVKRKEQQRLRAQRHWQSLSIRAVAEPQQQAMAGNNGADVPKLSYSTQAVHGGERAGRPRVSGEHQGQESHRWVRG